VGCFQSGRNGYLVMTGFQTQESGFFQLPQLAR
jgi:hypothetical protein